MINDKLMSSKVCSHAYKADKYRIDKPSAFYVAGRTVSIHFGNHRKGLPPIYFQICIETLEPYVPISKKPNSIPAIGQAILKGGRLISELPLSIEQETNLMTSSEKLAYAMAFNADIVNLLAGFIAEAKFIAIRDNEVITPRLVNVNSLRDYGVARDLQLLWDYFKCYGEYNSERETQLIGLYLAAFEFVNTPCYWQAVCEVANYIETSEKFLIECQEITDILDNSMKHNTTFN